MFKSIKRQITLFNTLTLGIFMFIFILLLGFLVKWSLTYSGEVYLMSVAKEIIQNDGRLSNRPISSSDSLHDKLGHQFIVWDSDNMARSSKVENRNLIIMGYELAIEENTAPRFQMIETEGIEYRVYTLPYVARSSSRYTVQVFQQVSTERSIVTYIISILFLIGLGSIAVLVPISYFLAGKSLKRVKDTFEDQKKFVENASHELRTPLTVIQTNVEVLRLKEDETIKDNEKWLNNIANEGETMAKLITELLLLAQAESRQVPFEKEMFDLSSMCKQIVDLMSELANEKKIKLSGDILPEVLCYGDEERLKQAVRILVDNAIKYTPDGGSVELQLLQGKRHLVVKVKDDGIGLTEEDKNQVFSRFYRVDDARNRETGGVGLGLNIADFIVGKHNGKIKIDSIPNKGSAFSIVLPKYSQKQN